MLSAVMITLCGVGVVFFVICIFGFLRDGKQRRIKCKRLTNTPVRMARSVLKCPNDRKNRVVSTQTTYPRGSSAVGGGVCEQRYAA